MTKKPRTGAVIAIVFLSILLCPILIYICFAAGIRHQISPSGTRDLSERIDFYGAIEKGLSKAGVTPEEWFAEQSDDDLLTRISYTENGLRGISDLDKFRSALREKAEDYADDFINKSGRGKLRTEEFTALARELYDDFVEYLDFHMLDEDFQDLEKNLNERNLEQYDFSNMEAANPEAIGAARFMLSDTCFFAGIGAALLLAVLICILSRRYLFRSLGITMIVAGGILLMIRGFIQIVMVYLLSWLVGVGYIILQAFHIFLSYILWGGAAAVCAGIVLLIISAAANKAAERKSAKENT